MIALVQRVSMARVMVGDESIGAIGPGLLALVCAQADESMEHAIELAGRVVRYRIFADAAGRMNRSLLDRQAAGEAAGALLVPQFTLAADTRSGLRPGFSRAAPPALARQRFDEFCHAMAGLVSQTQTGRFGADMQVMLINDGPVTFWLEHPARRP